MISLFFLKKAFDLRGLTCLRTSYHSQANNFNIGGINFETGDYGTCECNECTERRSKNKQWSHEDMAKLYPRLFKAAKANRPDLWTICEAYWDNILNLPALEPLKQVPQNAIFQYCTNRGYLVDQVFKQLSPEHVAKVPGSQKILRTHMGSQWQNERYTLVAERYAKMMQVAYVNGMHGATIFAEPSDFSVANEINYLAFARFGYNAKLTWNEFIRNDLAPLFGGEKEACEYLALLDPKRHLDAKSLKECLTTTRTLLSSMDDAHKDDAHKDDAHNVATNNTTNNANIEIHRRWVWLQNHLYKKLAMKQNVVMASLKKNIVISKDLANPSLITNPKSVTRGSEVTKGLSSRLKAKKLTLATMGIAAGTLVLYHLFLNRKNTPQNATNLHLTPKASM